MTNERKTAPWLPIDSAWWPNIAIELPLPWTREAVMMDLRWWIDQERMGRRKRPGRPALCKRWGWSDWQARSLMKDEAAWKQNLQPASSPPPTDIQDSTANLLKSQPALSSPPPARLQPASTRADIHKNTRTQEHTSEVAKATMSDKPDPLKVVWDRVLEIRAKHRPKGRRIKLTASRRRALGARLKDHDADELYRVIEWWLISEHSTAVWLREQGYDVDTLLRPANFDRYLEMAHADSQRTHASPPKPKRRSFMDDLRESADRLRAEQGAATIIPFTTTTESS